MQIWFTIFASCPGARRPDQRRLLRVAGEQRLRARETLSLPPAITVSVPVCAPFSPPETGASRRVEAARLRPLRELAREHGRHAGVIDEHGARRDPAKAPSGPSTTARRSSSLPLQRKNDLRARGGLRGRLRDARRRAPPRSAARARACDSRPRASGPRAPGGPPSGSPSCRDTGTRRTRPCVSSRPGSSRARRAVAAASPASSCRRVDARAREATRRLGAAAVAIAIEIPLRLLDQQRQRQRAAEREREAPGARFARGRARAGAAAHQRSA